jgi:hypothetical protein
MLGRAEDAAGRSRLARRVVVLHGTPSCGSL